MNDPAAPQCYRHPGRETWIRCQRCDRPICPDCMVAASVGFQCPSCVKEGSRSVRSAGAAYGGKRSADPRLTSFVLIGINVLVWLAILANGGQKSGLLAKLSLLPTGVCDAANGAGYYPGRPEVLCHVPGTQWAAGVANGSFWQLATSMFVHVEVWHIGFNMLALYFLGPQLEMVLGRARFLTLYLLSGLAGSAAVMLFAAPQSMTYGASGAIFGLMGALVVVGLKVHAPMQQLWFWIGLNLIFTFTAGGISWQGHLGGLAGGAVIAAIIAYAPRKRRPLVQAAGTTAFGVLVVLAIVVRALALA